MFFFKTVENSAQKATNLSLSQIKSFTPAQMRHHLESEKKRQFSFTSEFPYIGRGNVLRDSIKDTGELNKEIDKILK